MFTPGRLPAAPANNAHVGAAPQVYPNGERQFGSSPDSYGPFGGGPCTTCGGSNRADLYTLLGVDATLQVAPLGVQVGTNSAYPNQSGAAFGAAPNGTQGFNLNNNGIANTQMAFVVTFTPNCSVRLRNLFVDPQIAPGLLITAIYCGYIGLTQQQNLLSGRPGSNLNNQNLIPGIFLSLNNQSPSIPGFQSIDAVFTNTAPIVLAGITDGSQPSVSLFGRFVATVEAAM
jgi:hypothetical protein